MLALAQHCPSVEQGPGRPERYLLANGTRVPSVTEVLDATAGRAPGLEHWLMKNGFGAEHLKKDALQTGSLTHDAIEACIHGRDPLGVIRERRLRADLTHDARRALAGWRKWREGPGRRYRFIGTELPLISEKYHFGGTVDALMMDLETGEFLIGEWKTSKRFFESMPLQVGAYSVLMEEVRGIQISGAIVVKCSKANASFAEMNIGDPVLPIARREFIRRRKSHHYTKQIARFYGLGSA